MNYEFDIDTDDMGTIAFCFLENKWRADQYNSDGLANTDDDAYSFKDGELWRHNISGGAKNTIYGEALKSYIGVVSNGKTGKEKTWQTISVEGNFAPKANFKTVDPKVQESYLKPTKFTRRGPVLYAKLLRNGSGDQLYKGGRMRGLFMYCLFEFDTQAALEVRAINLGYKISAGNEFV